MDHILYQIFNFTNINKKRETMIDNAPISIYINRTENRIIFKIKIGYYFSDLKQWYICETKINIIHYQNGNMYNMYNAEIIVVILVPSNADKNDYQQDLRILHILVPSK